MKRALDLFFALLSLAVFAPLMLGIAAAIRIRMGAPVFFRQTRPGRGGRPFEILKFRTMAEGAGTDGDRLTPFGRMLRETSLDELPELINIAKGEMSFVGPRPLLVEYLPRYSPVQARRHEVRPGLTGWAQIKGRNALTWPEKFALDVWYVDNRTILLDVWILIVTVARIAQRKGISEAGEATARPFMGETGDAP
ncbi:MAG: sugar transferase [Pseudomonadota bacterium]